MLTPKQRIKNIIENNRYMVLSTAGRTGIPWVSPLYFASVGSKRFYWYSPREARHSKFIAKNPRVAITIFDSRAIPAKADAVYIQAHAHIVGKREIIPALLVYIRKYLSAPKEKITFLASARDFLGKSPLRMYVAETEKIWVVGPGKMYKNKYLDNREAVV